MKLRNTLTICILLVLCSCDSSTSENTTNNAMPKALEHNGSFTEIVTKRSGQDLVENMYEEIVAKDAELKKLEDMIEAIGQAGADSLTAFNKYNSKIKSYYLSADNYALGIKDSSTKQKVQQLLQASLNAYNANTNAYTNLLKEIESNEATMQDKHNLLKIIKTLPLIEKYQKEKLPDLKPINGYKKQIERVIDAEQKYTQLQ